MNRRDALIHLGAGTAGVLLQPRGLLPAATLAVPTLSELSRRIRETPRGRILDLAAEAMGNGAGPGTLLGATFLAGVHDVRPRPVGGNLHSVMVVESAYRLVETAASPRQAWLTALWTLDRFKATQREERGEPWVLPPAPRVSFAGEADARRELVAAMEGWDDDRADRAVVGLLPHLDREALFEVLWPYASRCMAYLGHKPIYGSMCEAVLRRLDWRHAQPTARSLVLGLLGIRYDAPQSASFDGARERAGAIPKGWLEGRGDGPGGSADLLAKLLGGSYEDAQGEAVAALRDGVAPRVIWDAALLGASELFLRRKSNRPESGEAIRAVHPFTEIWSLAHAWRATRLEETRKLLLLQAAAWVPQMRDMLLERDAISMSGPGILELGKDVAPPADLDELLEGFEPAATRAFLDRQPAEAPALLSRLKDAVPAKGTEYHQFKYLCAIEDELAGVHPRWASRLVAPAADYLPTHRTPDTDLTRRSLQTLRQAGIT